MYDPKIFGSYLMGSGCNDALGGRVGDGAGESGIAAGWVIGSEDSSEDTGAGEISGISASGRECCRAGFLG